MARVAREEGRMDGFRKEIWSPSGRQNREEEQEQEHLSWSQGRDCP